MASPRSPEHSAAIRDNWIRIKFEQTTPNHPFSSESPNIRLTGYHDAVTFLNSNVIYQTRQINLVETQQICEDQETLA